MKAEPSILFPPFYFEPADERLWRGAQAITLRPKTLAVLRYFLAHPGRLVTKEELLNAVWPVTYVSEALVKNSILEIRQALGDDPRVPQFIETVHGRGYRFIAKVISGQHSAVSSHSASPAPSPQYLVPTLVGRETELTQLHTWLDRALTGERQVIFVTGEAGIGKTTIVEAFLEQIGHDGTVWKGQGQCIEQFGAGEPYLPILSAVGQLCREPGHEELIEVLKQYAPTWLVQMPALIKSADLDKLHRNTQGATQERMLREMVEALEAFTSERSLVLLLEDLHWSDPSTLELFSYIARRKLPARLLVIGTYRSMAVMFHEHPLRTVIHELQLHRQCEELKLMPLTETNVAAYLAERFSEKIHRHAFLQDLARLVYERTEGNPLFMVNVVDDLARCENLESQTFGVSVPTTIRQMIERQFEQLTAVEQLVLEVASAAGVVFSAVAVAAGERISVAEIETQCVALARRGQFIRANEVSEWPDGTMVARYEFLHALYQEILYDRLPVTRRMELHQRIGKRLEAGYGERTREIAGEIAMHFLRGRQHGKAIQYLHQAGENAIRRSASREAMSLFGKGLELLQTLSDTHERTQRELTLQIALGAALIATKGYAAQEVEQAYTRAHELCQKVGDTPQLLPALSGLWGFHLVRGEHKSAHELAEQFFSLAQCQYDAAPAVQAHYTLGTTLFLLGELVSARAHVEQACALYEPQQHRILAFVYGGVDARTDSLSYVALTGWYLGYADQALESIRIVLALAQDLSHPFSLAFALFHAAELHYLRRDGRAVQEQTATLIALSHDQGFPETLALGAIFQGWALAEQGQAEEGIAQLHEGLATLRAIGTEVQRPYYLAMLAEAYGKTERPEEGLRIVAEALAQVDKTGERYYEAELHRIKGELRLQQESQKSKGKSQKSKVTDPRPPAPDPQGEAEACFLKAIDIARKQEAKSVELRAVMSLVRLRQQQASEQRVRSTEQRAGRRKQGTRTTQHAVRTKLDKAHQMLFAVYNWFTEGFDTKDLQDAKALIEELSH